MINQPAAFRIGQGVTERGTPHCGHVEAAGKYPDEWIIRLVGGQRLTCLGENLVPKADAGALARLPRHQCFIYGGAPSSHLPEIARTLVERFEANHRCLYLNSPTMVAGMRSQLAAGGIDPRAQTDRGAIILSSDLGHLVDGVFNVERLLELLRDAMKAALAEGYLGLWAAGDMTWEFGNEANLDKLAHYERCLDELMRRHPALSGICLYHRDTLPAHAIETAHLTHPAVFLSATLSQINPRYAAPPPFGPSSICSVPQS